MPLQRHYNSSLLYRFAEGRAIKIFGIGMGSSPAENSQYGSLTSASGFATQLGEGDLSSSSAFMQSILSGDPSRISSVLAPTFSALKTSVQQDQKTGAMSGNRAGGTNAATAASADKAHSDITNATANLTGNAASSLASEGSGLLSTGISGDEAGFSEANTLQQQRLAKINDIINSSIAVAAAPFTGGASLAGLNSGGGGGKGLSGGFSLPSFGGGTSPNGAGNPSVITDPFSGLGSQPTTDWGALFTGLGG
jgi:hypothetical protein